MTTRRKVNGYITDGTHMKAAEVDVRFTSDKTGEAISLCVGDTMIGVPFEAVKPVIMKERAKNGKKKM